MRKIAHFLSGFLLLTLPFPANAELVGFRYTGQLLFPAFGIEGQLSGDFSYETSVPTSSVTPDTGIYDESGIPGAQLRFYAGPVNEQFQIQKITVVNAIKGYPDSFHIEAFRYSDLGFEFADFNLSDNTLTAFSDGSLPVTLALSDFQYGDNYLHVDRAGPVYSEYLAAEITSLDPIAVSSVPLPSSLILLASGFVVLLPLGLRRKRNTVLRPLRAEGRGGTEQV